MPSTHNPLADLRGDETARVLRALRHPTQHSLNTRFPFWALDGQEPPRATASGADWRSWVIVGGRGFGKTRAGAEWVLALARGKGSKVRIALVAATIDEARAVMVEGVSGILACAQPGDIRDWSPSRGIVRFASGAEAALFSGASPDSLRGPGHDFAWCDELAKWKHPEATWDNLSFGLRRGDWPRVVVTTTPQSSGHGAAVLEAILAEPDTVQTGGSTRGNVYLPPAYVSAMERRYAGTRKGEQELEGRMPSDVEGSLWPKALIAASRIAADAAGAFARIVIGVDPPASVSGTCGIVVCGLEAGPRDVARAVVLADASVGGCSPEGWARAVADAAAHWNADRVIAENNQGGDMVESVLRAANPALPLRLERAVKSKGARAEPIATRFESGRAVFGGRFPELEAELTGMQIAGGYTGPGTSPDRADAMVWALWALTAAPPPGDGPRIRVL